jgi:hypothetical protein
MLDGHQAGLVWVFELMVRASDSRQNPPVHF